MNGGNPCAAYLEHLQAEHHHLNCALVEIRHQFAELNRSTQPQDALADLVKRLEYLLRELRSHIAEEEAGGCLEEVVARCPSLGPQTDDLMSEHPQLDRALEQLLEGIKSRAVIGEAWQKQFEAFAADLRVHESAENRLLQTALGGDAAEYDEEGNE